MVGSRLRPPNEQKHKILIRKDKFEANYWKEQQWLAGRRKIKIQMVRNDTKQIAYLIGRTLTAEIGMVSLDKDGMIALETRRTNAVAQLLGGDSSSCTPEVTVTIELVCADVLRS
ncbi:unnamed protein product [Anisakis simplex]|uniref:RNase_PH domain-containing protein n=1 Tax=Anisakis simplex TaxID=6269 RepID=A0A0M3JW40_ANISI|nr:unnamed protein product [Anisakis simplex]